MVDAIIIEKLPDEGGGGGSNLPEVTQADDGKVLTVVDGEWAAVPASSFGQRYFDLLVESDAIPFKVATCTISGAKYLMADNDNWNADEQSAFYNAVSYWTLMFKYGAYSPEYFTYVVNIDGVEYDCVIGGYATNYPEQGIAPRGVFLRLVPKEPDPTVRTTYPLVDEIDPIYIDITNNNIYLVGETAGTHSISVSVARYTELPPEALPWYLTYGKDTRWDLYFGIFTLT